MNLQNLNNNFISRYGNAGEEIHAFFAPGRVNLIGEHTDYNGGYVLPCALSYGTYMLVRKSTHNNVKLASENFEFNTTVPLADISQKIDGQWVNFPLGVFDQYINIGEEITGLEILFSGDIPDGAGLSSSASIEVVTAFAVNELYNCGLSLVEIALLSRKCEHEFIGVQCGIMDQFAVTLGKKDHALFLNCGTMKFVHVPVDLTGYQLIISNTNKKRELADSKYNERVKECNLAVESIRKKMPIRDLSVLNLPDFRNVEHFIRHPVRRNRAYHVVNENYRVLEAVKALKHGELEKFGKLMNASHESLKNYYEVTGFELDTLVEEARKIDGVIGSRMTGAGFGGCTVSIVRNDKVEEFQIKAGEGYFAKTGLHADFYLPQIGDGVRRIDG